MTPQHMMLIDTILTIPGITVEAEYHCTPSGHQISPYSFTEQATVNLLPLHWKPFSAHEKANLEVQNPRISYQAFPAEACEIILARRE